MNRASLPARRTTGARARTGSSRRSSIESRQISTRRGRAKTQRAAHVDKVSLNPTLDPARPLARPIAPGRRHLLHRHGVDDGHLEANRASRMPRSASSVTLKGSRPPIFNRRSRLKWFDVPPSVTGSLRNPSAGSKPLNSAEYSSAKLTGQERFRGHLDCELRLYAGEPRSAFDERVGGAAQLSASGMSSASNTATSVPRATYSA